MDPSVVSNSIANYPEVLAVLVLIIGVIGARVVRGAVSMLLESVDRRLSRYATSSTSMISPRMIEISRNTVFWLIILFAVAISVRLLGVHQLAEVLESTIAFLPKLLVGLVIIGVGHLLGLTARNLLGRLAGSVGPESVAARILHAAIVVIAVVLGLQQMSIDITFITQLVLVMVVVGMGAMALAFALGAREHVANVIANTELRRYAVGERVRIGEHEGTIVEIHTTGLQLSAPEGMVSIPASFLATTAVLRLTGDDASVTGAEGGAAHE